VTIPTFDRAILGGGPVGLIAALQSAKLKRTLLITRTQPKEPRNVATPPRIESVPATLVNLLLDFSIDPRRIGVDRLHDTRHAAWETEDPSTSGGRAVAHLDRNHLTAELLAVADRHPTLSIKSEARIPVRCNGLWHGTSWRARTLLDATGRAMVMSARRLQPPKPWVARPFWRIASSTPAGRLAADRTFRIAALPFGYVYRLGSNTTDMVWVVGRGEVLSLSPASLEGTLRASGAGWLLNGFAPLTDANTGRSHPASVRWPEGSLCSPIGGAALSRDILSSQGLAAGISDALYATAACSDDDGGLLAQRHSTELAAHLKSLQHVFASCRHRERREWRAYAEFVTTHHDSRAFPDRVALFAGRVTLKSPGLGFSGTPSPDSARDTHGG
jgi:2-polyprenyl-6-methoxyphenol hydroxylase-like FAD-dependent oxidoreductase